MSGFEHNARAWLASLPNGATVRWGTDHAQQVPDVHTSWIDVICPAAQAVLATNWLVTIELPQPDEQPDGIDTIAVEPDTGLIGRYEHFDWVPGTVRAASAGEVTDNTDSALCAVHGWSTALVCDTMRDWSDRLAGRGDLRWEFDPELRSDKAVAADELLDALLSGDDAGIDLGDGVIASNAMFDQLLAEDPDVAADIVSTVKELLAE
jgi:hypothetical protein